MQPMAPNQTRGGKQQHKFEASDTTTNMPRGKSDAPKLTGEQVLKLMDLYCTGKVGKGGGIDDIREMQSKGGGVGAAPERC